MDVFLMIRRKKTTMFLDAKENTTVSELKKMIEGITKQPPNQQKLYNHDDTVGELLCSFFIEVLMYIFQSVHAPRGCLLFNCFR